MVVLALLFLLLPAVGAGAGRAGAQAAGDGGRTQTTPITQQTDNRILSLLDAGTEMLVEQRYQQAYNHYQTFALQFPGSGPLMQAWALSSRMAEKQDELALETQRWDGQGGRPTAEMAAFVRAYLDLFHLDLSMAPTALDQALADVRGTITDGDLRYQESAALQLLLGMISMRGSGDLADTLAEAQAHVEAARALDPDDPTVTQLAAVIRYLIRLEALVARREGLSNQEIAQAHLEVGAIESGRLPDAIRQRSATLMQALVLQQDRDQDMPREYLRGLANVIALRDLGVEGAETAATTWETAAQLPPYRAQPSFQVYGSFLGRFLACYGDEVQGVNLLSRVEGIQFNQSQDLTLPQGRAAAQRRLETLVLLWRFSSRMRLPDEARAYRDEAIALSERLANRTRPDLVNGPWVRWGLAAGLSMGLLALLGLLLHFTVPRRAVVGRNTPAEERSLRRRLSAVLVRLMVRHDLSVMAWWLLGGAVVLLSFFGTLWLVERFFEDHYPPLYALTNTLFLGSLALGGALLIGVVLGALAIGRPRLAPTRVASGVDQRLGLNGVAETVFGLDGLSKVSGRTPSALRDNAYLFAQLPEATFRIRPAKLVTLLPGIALVIGAAMLTSAAAASFQLLPLPQFDPVELPEPQICPPPSSDPSEELQEAELRPVPPPTADGDDTVGLDVNNSDVPENQIDQLNEQIGVGGTDDVGEPFDYHTTLPSRTFESERNVDGVDGFGASQDIPDGLAGRGRQSVPDRFMGL